MIAVDSTRAATHPKGNGSRRPAPRLRKQTGGVTDQERVDVHNRIGPARRTKAIARKTRDTPLGALSAHGTNPYAPIVPLTVGAW